MPIPLILIPARMSAARLPGKPLADICGLPLILHVAGRAKAANAGRVVVAAGDAEIADVVRAGGFEAVLTDPDLPSGTDRVRACADQLDPGGTRDVVNLQGDMAVFDPSILTRALSGLGSAGTDAADMATLIRATEETGNPDSVKAVVAADGRALYFTRADAPSGPGPRWHHIGVYAFRRAALTRFCDLAPSPLERREGLEQLRALEAGMRIACIEVTDTPISVDTPADLDRARKALA